MKKKQISSVRILFVWFRCELLNWLCGNEAGQNHYVFWWGFHIGMQTKRGRIAYQVIRVVDWCYRAPQRCRLALADRLAMVVSRLRKEKVYVHGWGRYAIGNEAADLRDQIETAMIVHMPNGAFYDEAHQQLDRLAHLAEAVSWRNRVLANPGATVSTEQG